MPLVRHFLTVLAIALFPLGCTPIGCSGEDPELDHPSDEQFVGAVEQQLPAPGTSPLYGTWIAPKVAERIDHLVIMTDGRYHTAQAVVCPKAPCDPIVQDGPFKLYSREGRTYIELQQADRVPDRYEYVASSNHIRIRPLVAGSEWFAMDSAGIAWCGTDRDCNVQNLPPGICAGRYECAQNACMWKCAISGGPAAAQDTDKAGAVNPEDSKTP
jgi:hypothetical protein